MCDVTLSNKAWQEAFTMRVKATTDHLYDGDHVTSLTIIRQNSARNEAKQDTLISSKVEQREDKGTLLDGVTSLFFLFPFIFFL